MRCRSAKLKKRYRSVMPPKLDFNLIFTQALELMEDTSRNVFITGRAGTGKSTLLTYFRKHTKKNVVVLAPTGVAAVNISGQTIHSFFHFKPDITKAKVKKIKVAPGDTIYSKLDAIVIDEISMVRADLLDCVDLFLRLHGPSRKKPFGGVQMIFIGDLYQLPPVTTSDESKAFAEHYQSPYFFSAHVISPPQQSLFNAVIPTTPTVISTPQEKSLAHKTTDSDSPKRDRETSSVASGDLARNNNSRNGDFKMEFIELQKIYRQSDSNFIALLNAIRNNTAGAAEFAALNKRHNPQFVSPDGELYITLTTTNRLADEINAKEVERLQGEERVYRGSIEGKFDNKYLPTDVDLRVKVGTQVMMLNNDSQGRWINGTIGEIVGIDSSERANGGTDSLLIELETGDTVQVNQHQWDIYQFSFNEKAKQIESKTVGSFLQYPLRLAWAVTIHKSQGKTFERVIVDIGSGTFSPGQLYVALSRATTLDGLVLKRPLSPRHVWLDKEVGRFISTVSNYG